MPTFRQTPFRDGRPTVAGERGRRALRVERPRVRTWLRVAWEVGVDVKGREEGRRAIVVGMILVGVRIRRRRAWRRVRDGGGSMIACRELVSPYPYVLEVVTR